MRIAFLSLLASDEQPSSGLRTAVRELARGLAMRGHQVSILTSGTPCTYLESGVAYVQLARLKKFERWTDLLDASFVVSRLIYMSRAAHWVRSAGVDLVEVAEAGLENAFLLKRRPCKMVARLHGNVSYTIGRTPLSRALERLEGAVTRRADAIYSPSRTYADWIARDYRLDRGSVHVIPHGVDIESLRGTPERAGEPRERWALGDRRIVLYSGALTERKGVRVLRQVAQALLGRDDIVLVAAGREVPGSDLRFPPNVVTTGELSRAELCQLYREAAVFLMPSCFDNMSLSIIEAMVFGLPVVAFDVCGNRELVQDDVNGFLVDRFHAARIPALLCSVLDDAATRRRLGETSAKLAERHDLRAVVSSVESLFAAVINGGARAATERSMETP